MSDLTPWQKYKQNLGSTRPWDLLNPNTGWAAQEDAASRFDLCKNCEFFLTLTNQCKKCGCFMHLKTKLADAKCPIGKW